MNDRSFIRFGGWAGILLALTSWATVVVYLVMVPAAQHLPITDANAFLESLAVSSTGTQLYYALYALIAVWAFIGIVAMYFHLRARSEAWIFFATLIAGIAAVLTIVNGLQQMAFYRYLGALSLNSLPTSLVLLNMPAPLNPVGAITQGLTAPWFLVVSILLLRGNSRLLALIGFVAFADLTVGFLGGLFGIDLISIGSAVIAGAVGGPIFWILAALELFKVNQPAAIKQGAPTLVVAK